MKIILPIEFSSQGGVERVIVSLLSHLEKYTDKIIVLVSPSKLEYFQAILPSSEIIEYKVFPFDNWSIEAIRLAFLRRSADTLGKLGLPDIKNKLYAKISRLSVQYRINQLIRDYNLDYCIYPLINKLEPPQTITPLIGISHDLFWQFSPLTYTESYRDKYNYSLKLWLDKASLIIAVSEKTRQDIFKVFPQSIYKQKVKTILSAGSPIQLTASINSLNTAELLFYFPSSFSIYKDHLTLLKAVINLANKNYKFKVILTGKDTDKLINGSMKLSQQSSTEEYQDYVGSCQDIYQKNQEIIQKYFLGLGYTDYKTVEYYYQTCNCILMPSQYEGFGLAISEALLLGIPVIAADLEVYREQVELYQCPERVEFFPVGDAQALAQCLEQFILAPRSRLSQEELASSCRSWTWDDVAQEYMKAFKAL
jgi:glycosyltransferase involved in cell wall biosynthesis